MSENKNNPKPQNFYIGIKAAIVNNNKALIVADPRFSGYDLPGGKIDEGEDIEQALKRELKEELGLKDFKLGELIYAFPRHDYHVEGTSIMLIFYIATTSVSNIALNDEHSEFKWIDKYDLKDLVRENKLRNDGVRMALEKALK